MGSIGDEDLVQMVRDYIESTDPPSSISAASSKPTSRRRHHHQSTYLTLQRVLGTHTDDEIEIQEKITMYLKNMRNIGEAKKQKKWVAMKLKVDGHEASLCKTTWDSTFSCSKVFQFTENYEYIEVYIMDKKNGDKQTRLIVDMDFRSQFEVARPTRTYKELINSLPSIFVGNEEKLKEVISVLCSAGKKSMKEKGLHYPPWRSVTYMQSKWLSTNCKKVSFSSNTELGMDQSDEKSTPTCCPLIFS